MSYRRDSDAFYGREAKSYNEYRGSASTTFDNSSGGWYPSGPYLEEAEEPDGRRSAPAFHEQVYRYARVREPPYQSGRIATNQRGFSSEYQSFQNQAPRPTFDHLNGHRDGASYFGDRAAVAGYHHREPDIPSMLESETSSIENYCDDDHWNSKTAAATKYSSHRQSEDSESEFSYANANKPAAIGSRLSVPQAASPHTKDSTMKSIEVSPGQFFRLRGAEETLRAIACDFYMPSACLCCSLTLFCIQDACFVLCPECRVVSPMEGIVFEGSEGGVGMGFKIEELAKCHEDIERDRRLARKNQTGGGGRK